MMMTVLCLNARARLYSFLLFAGGFWSAWVDSFPLIFFLTSIGTGVSMVGICLPASSFFFLCLPSLNGVLYTAIGLFFHKMM